MKVMATLNTKEKKVSHIVDQPLWQQLEQLMGLKERHTDIESWTVKEKERGTDTEKEHKASANLNTKEKKVGHIVDQPLWQQLEQLIGFRGQG